MTVIDEIAAECPKCGEECDRDSVDVGVGVIHGPYGCASCGWSEDPEYDLSAGRDPVDEKGGAIDQWGGYHPPGRVTGQIERVIWSTT